MILTIGGFLALVVVFCSIGSIIENLINYPYTKGSFTWAGCCMVWAFLFFCENQELNKLRSSLPTTNTTAIVLENNVTSNSVVKEITK